MLMATIHAITIRRKLVFGTSEDVPEQQDMLVVVSQCTLRFIRVQGFLWENVEMRTQIQELGSDGHNTLVFCMSCTHDDQL